MQKTSLAASPGKRSGNPDFEPQGMDNLKGLSYLAGRFALLKINNEAQTRTTGQGQILLGNLQLFPPRANSGAKLFRTLSYHSISYKYLIL